MSNLIYKIGVTYDLPNGKRLVLSRYPFSPFLNGYAVFELDPKKGLRYNRRVLGPTQIGKCRKFMRRAGATEVAK